MSAPAVPAVQIVAAESPPALAQARVLQTEYAATPGHDLSAQGFAHELAGLPGPYSSPRGCLFLVRVQSLAAVCG